VLKFDFLIARPPEGTSVAFQSTERRHVPLATLTTKPTSNASQEIGRGFRLWPISEMAKSLVEVRLLGSSGLDSLTLSSSHFDPKATLVTRQAPWRRRTPVLLFARS
jgi:hypothetical protein